ncbi:uncharacterized protein LOC123292574 [Chrysoperla carnea]|uniref:uncharacterized protein LOC123292574 n=1 Tax=Chrysoperla carnea TaxID=189513 RepID=UPI001D07BDF3|nr:uncharacterized protein LOC123292574 [Chrysoperla carnea]
MKFTILLSCATLIVFSNAELTLSPYLDLANKITEIAQNNRQQIADGFKGLPPLEPISITGPFSYTTDAGFITTLSDVTINGITSFNYTNLVILDNGVFIFTLDVPQVTVEGEFSVDAPQYTTKGFSAILPDVQIIFTGFLNVDPSNSVTLNEAHVNVNIHGNTTVKVIGLPGLLDDLVRSYFEQEFSNIINNHSNVYEDPIADSVQDYINTNILQKYSFSQLENIINQLKVF